MITKSELLKTHNRKTIPSILTAEERRLLLAAPNKKAPCGYRNFAIITVFLNTGIRISELINLKLADIDWKDGKIYIRQGKGNKDRVLWLNREDRAIVKKWLDMRPVFSDYVFCSLKGGPVNDRYIRDFIERYAEQKNIKKRVYPHMLRHTFATDLLENSGNIRLVQKALGHSSLLTTMIYTHIVDSKLEKAMKTFRSADLPGANISP